MAVKLGTTGNDSISGSGEDDLIFGNAGNDTLLGAGGNDTLYGDSGHDRLLGGSGDDTLRGDSLGDVGNDTLSGGEGNDRIEGGDGNDLLHGDNGDDYLQGDIGNDTIYGDAGNDTIFGYNAFSGSSYQGMDTDLLYGGAGNDSITAFWYGNSTLDGGDGNDALVISQPYYQSGEHPTFVARGGRGADSFDVSGADANFRLEGGDGNDFFTLGLSSGSRFEVSGGAGSDIMQIENSLANREGTFAAARVADFKSGAGGDRLDLRLLLDDFQTSWWFNGAGDDPFASGHFRFAQAGSDTVLQYVYLGSAAKPWVTAVRLQGVTATSLTLADNIIQDGSIQALTFAKIQSTAPTVVAPLSNQATPSFYVDGATVFADSDGDSLALRATRIDGSALPDWLSFYSAGDSKYRFLDDGTQPANASVLVLLTAYDSSGKTATDTFWIGIPGQEPTSGNDSFAGTSGNDVFAGLGGDDKLIGNAGNDKLLGNEGNDALNGGAGSDTLDGGAGNDSMAGGAGNDTYVVNASGDKVVEAANGGTDTVRTSITYTLGANVEKLVLTGSAQINGTGNSLANHITGSNATNKLSGAAGNDTLSGGAANDVLIGGAGSDRLTGGAGKDIFQFDSKIGSDTITDFRSVDDALRFSQAGLRIGDGDTTVDGFAVRNASGGFSAATEVVVFTPNAASLAAGGAAAVVGSATSSFAAGATRLFVVDNGTDSGIFLFTSSSANAQVSASELTLIATVNGTSAVASDYLFVA